MATPQGSDDGTFSDMPTRPMRVKVLYTFDAEHKTNCLARFQETHQIPVVPIDESSQIGVIELAKCIQTVVNASPELTADFSNHDFAIYAYDYSETDCPLVGQGMLSASLNAHNAQNLIHSSGSGPMITGRVLQNLPAVFNNGVKETLEVKLRFMPVRPVATKTLESPRSMSPATNAGFDPNAWNQMQGNRLPQNDFLNFDLTATGDDSHSLIDEIMGLSANSGGESATSDMGIGGTPTDSIFDEGPAFASHSHSAPGSRVGSPAVDSNPTHPNRPIRHQSFSTSSYQNTANLRHGSRASPRSELQGLHPPSQIVHQPEQLSPNHEEYQDEEGNQRKRARIMQTDWRGRSSFGGKSSNLRVTASTAASMQMHRPVPTRPFPASVNNLEPPPRVPTPVPQRSVHPHRRNQRPLAPHSLLRQASTTSSALLSDNDQHSDAAASSPEDESPRSLIDENTPGDIPSSPPIFANHDLPYTTSPRVHSYSKTADSGYMSEQGMGQAGRGHADDSCSPEFQPDSWGSDNALTRPFIKREDTAMSTTSNMLQFDHTMSDMPFEMDLPGEEDLNVAPSTHYRMASRAQNAYAPSQSSSRAASPMNDALATIQPRPARPIARRSSLALPTLAPSDQSGVARKRQQSHRASSFYPESDMGSPAPSDTEGRPSGPRRSGSGAPRRKIIQDRLADAVAKGEMPQFCSHCGAIETPTWRRLYVNYIDGKPSPLDYVEGEGETIGIEELDWDEATGEVTRFIIRKSMKKTKDLQPGKGFKDVQLCNPCGLWFSKTRKMRPQDKWGRRSGTRRSRKSRVAEAGDLTDGLEPRSDALYTDAIGPEDTFDEPDAMALVPRRTSTDLGLGDAQMAPLTHDHGRRQSQAVVLRMEGPDRRVTRSSPAKLHGTQESPIELDDRTPKPIRRLLFPSPRQAGQTKTLDNADISTSKNVTPKSHHTRSTDKTEISISDEQRNMSVYEMLSFGKENLPPLEDEESLTSIMTKHNVATHKTPQKQQLPVRRSPRSLEKLLKTPNSGSSIALTSRKRKIMATDAQAGEVVRPKNDFMTSPASSRYYLRSTPTRLANTPGRSSQWNGAEGENGFSPFSRELADMLANDTSLQFDSPSKGFAFSDLPPFPSPESRSLHWDGLNIDSSDFNAIGEEVLGMEEKVSGQ